MTEATDRGSRVAMLRGSQTATKISRMGEKGKKVKKRRQKTGKADLLPFTYLFGNISVTWQFFSLKPFVLRI